jgi:CRP-like cAMP-binding protein
LAAPTRLHPHPRARTHVRIHNMGAVCSNASKTPRGSFVGNPKGGSNPQKSFAPSSPDATEVIVTTQMARSSSSSANGDEKPVFAVSHHAPASPSAPATSPVAATQTATIDDPPATPPPEPAVRASTTAAGAKPKKRVAIAVENISDASSIPTVPKDEATRTLILEATESNTLFEGLDLDTRLALIDVMTKKRVDAECDVIAQGAENDDARHFYVLEKGKCAIRVRRRDPVDGKPVMSDPERTLGSYASGDSFGELALLYGAPRAATIRATTDCELWALDRSHYMAIKRRFQERLSARKRELVDSVELFRALSPEHKATIADALKCEVFDEGDVVITEGETGDRFYVVSSGKFNFYFPCIGNWFDGFV